MQFPDLLNDLISHLGFGKLDTVDEHSATLRLRLQKISVRHDAKTECLRFSTILGTPNEKLGHGLFPILLKTNTNPSNFAAGSFAVDIETGEVLLVREDRLAALDLLALETIIAEFCILAQSWSQVVEKYNASAEEVA